MHSIESIILGVRYSTQTQQTDPFPRKRSVFVLHGEESKKLSGTKKRGDGVFDRLGRRADEKLCPLLKVSPTVYG